MEQTFIDLFNNQYLRLLVVVILLDILAGTVRAIIQKALNSSIGTTGLLKHMLILISISVLAIFAPLFDLVLVANAFIGFYIFQYGLSIVENWQAIGLPVPNWVKERMNNKKMELNEKPIDLLKK